MLAAVVEKPNVMVIKDVPKPIISDDDFLIKVLASSICNATDNHILEGIFDGYHNFYPQILGHEVCGEVVEVGKNVARVKMGQRVALYTPNGAFAEYCLVEPERTLAIIPDHMSSEVACACETFDGAYTSMVAPAMLTENDTALFIGAGPLGLAAIGTAAVSTKNIIVVDFYQNRLNMAREFGAKYTYNRSEMSVDEIVEVIKKDVGEVDVTFMCIALDRSDELDAFHLAIEATKRGGGITGLNVEVQHEHHNHRMNPMNMNRKNITYRHFLRRESIQSDFQKGFDMVADGLVPLEKEITHRVTLDKLQWALDMTHNHLDECIKVIVYPWMEE